MNSAVDFRDALLAKKTPAERKFESILKDLGVDYAREWRIKTKKGATKYLDFFVGRKLSGKNKASQKARRKGKPQPYYGLGFEIDGKIHDGQQYYDIKRDSEIMENSNHIFIIRFTNEDVIEETEKVKTTVVNALREMRLFRKAASV